MRLSHETATLAFGAALSRVLPNGSVVYLHGELGCGKTTLVRGLLHTAGWTGRVRSPTYTLLESYPLAPVHYLHLDLYRLNDAEELEYLGLRDWLALQPIWLIEWPERGLGVLPPPDVDLHLAYADGAREVQCQAATALGREIIAKLPQLSRELVAKT